MAKLIFGCGYLGARVARLWRAAGHEVYVVTRDPRRAAELAAEGYRPIVADVVRPDSLVGLPSAETVLWAVGYDRSAGAALDDVFVSGVENMLRALPAGTGRLIYTSSTGVYGQTQGEWIDEDSATEPERAGGRACLAAERTIAAHPLGSRAVILRMAGLYGPRRVPQMDAVRQGRSISAPEHGYLNLIHVDDAAAVVLAAADRARAPRTFVVSDGCPVERRDYYDQLARLLDAAPVVFAAAAAVAGATVERLASNKRVRNARMVAELQVPLAYPSFREALAAIVATEGGA